MCVDAARSVHFERHAAAEHPGRQDQIRIADGVIGVQVGHERHAQLDRIERGDPAIDDCRFRATHDTCTEVDQVGRVVHDDGCGGAGAIRIGRRSAGAEQYDLRLLGVSGRVQDQRDESHAPAQYFPCEHAVSPHPRGELRAFRTGREPERKSISQLRRRRTDDRGPGPTPLHRRPAAPTLTLVKSFFTLLLTAALTFGAASRSLRRIRTTCRTSAARRKPC